MLQQTNGKLRSYITFKSNFGREKHLSVLKSFEQRRCLTQLRISCHQLKMETVRYQGTLLQDSKCERCSSGEVEDEYTFLFHCNKLENDRNLLLKEIAKIGPNFKRLNSKDKLIWLMNTEEKSVLATIATFIVKNMK
jgi:phage terminase large subunit-like protein